MVQAVRSTTYELSDPKNVLTIIRRDPTLDRTNYTLLGHFVYYPHKSKQIFVLKNDQ